uniref:Prokineticin 2 n=1 Tax=Hucho hucho TaxID=62062 RepID=A0A4W5NRD9_9TELE
TFVLCCSKSKYLFNQCEACVKDLQCGEGMCCAVSLWIRSLRMCAPIGQKGDECHPMSHKVVLISLQNMYSFVSKVPFIGTRLHHTCPCVPNLECITTSEGKSKCLSPFNYSDYYL